VPTAEANVVPATLVGMQIEGEEVEAWSSAPFGALRLWDNGTAWSQIETSKGVPAVPRREQRSQEHG
jgi:hypothetical protein